MGLERIEDVRRRDGAQRCRPEEQGGSFDAFGVIHSSLRILVDRRFEHSSG
jgi:hypothetical protein